MWRIKQSKGREFQGPRRFWRGSSPTCGELVLGLDLGLGQFFSGLFSSFGVEVGFF